MKPEHRDGHSLDQNGLGENILFWLAIMAFVWLLGRLLIGLLTTGRAI